MSSSWLYLYVPKTTLSYKGNVINAVIASGMNGLVGLFAYSVGMDCDKDFRRFPLHSVGSDVMQAIELLLAPLSQYSGTDDFLCLFTEDLSKRFLAMPAKSDINTEDLFVSPITIHDVTVADSAAFQLLMDSFWADVEQRQYSLELLCRSYYDQLQLECLSFARYHNMSAKLLWSILLDIDPEVITAKYNYVKSNTWTIIMWCFLLCLACVLILLSVILPVRR